MLLGFFVSGVLGIARTVVIAAQFGTGSAADAFAAAQQLPELIFVLVAGGALSSSFVPVFARFRQKDEAAAWRLASAILVLTAGAALTMSVIVIAVAPIFVPILERGASAEQQRLTTELTQWMMLTPIIFSISGLLMSVLHSYGRFALPALAIGMNNLGYIFGAVGLARWLPPDAGIGQVGDANIFGLALGALLSALLHLAVQLPGLRGLGARLRFFGSWRGEGVGDVLRLMGPRVLGLAVVRVNFLVNVVLTSHMVAGSRAALTNAFIFVFFVIGIIGQSVGTAVFPTLAATHHAGDVTAFRERLGQALRSVLLLAIPGMVGLWLLSEPLLAVLLERGVWSASSTAATAWALRFFALGLPAFVTLEVLSRAFYALEDTRTPVLLGILAMLANIGLSLVLIGLVGDPHSLEHGPFAGLALANASTTTIEALALVYLLQRRVGGICGQPLLMSVVRMGLAAALMGGVVVVVHQVLARSSPWLSLSFALVAGALSYFAAAALLQLEEARAPLAALRRRLS